MSDGWIKIHRKFLDWEWYDKSEMVHLFLHLLLNASVSNKRWHNTPVNRGQLVTSYESLRIKTGLSVQTLRTCLARLEETGEIERYSTNKFTIITVCKYEEYQCDTSDNDSQPTDNAQANNTPEQSKPKKTKEEIKAETEKRMKEFYKSLVPYVQTYGKEMVRAFYDYWSETNKSGSKMKWEQEPTWVLEKRLQRWANNDKSYKGKSNDNVNSRTSTTAAERAQGAASVIASLAAEE
jgi:hypothetical protein